MENLGNQRYFWLALDDFWRRAAYNIRRSLGPDFGFYGGQTETR